MLTPALKRLVRPVLKDAAYSVKPGTLPTTVLFVFQNQYGRWQGAVVDYPNLRVLAIIVALPGAGRGSCSVTNMLNRRRLGKFTLDGQGRLDYCLEFFYSRRTTPADFAHALELALLSVIAKKHAPQHHWEKGGKAL